MSERTLHIYRVTEVAEHLVDDDGIYEDDVDMLRDVVEAAREGLLEFEPTTAEFVAMVWDDENRLVVREIRAEGEVPEASPDDRRFCARCLAALREAANGAIICPRGHEDERILTRAERDVEFARRSERSTPRGDFADAPSRPPPTPRRSPRERRSR